MTKRGNKIWWNGKTISEADAHVSLFTHTLHYGYGAFEGIRAYRQTRGGGAIFRLQEHMQRLVESSKILGIAIKYSATELSEAAVELCRINGFEECYVRPIVFIGEGPLGVNPGTNPPVEVAILTWEWGKYLGDEGVLSGIKLKVSSYIRPHVNSQMTKAKAIGHYINGVLAKREAISLGFDEGLMLDAEGYVTEGTGENVFMVKGGVIKTTPLTSILNGITRQTVIQYLLQQGHTVVEQRFTRDELICADEIFLSGTAAEITPVSMIDATKIGYGEYEGKPGPLTKKVQNDYQAMVRGDLTLSGGEDWLSPI